MHPADPSIPPSPTVRQAVHLIILMLWVLLGPRSKVQDQGPCGICRQRRKGERTYESIHPSIHLGSRSNPISLSTRTRLSHPVLSTLRRGTWTLFACANLPACVQRHRHWLHSPCRRFCTLCDACDTESLVNYSSSCTPPGP